VYHLPTVASSCLYISIYTRHQVITWIHSRARSCLRETGSSHEGFCFRKKGLVEDMYIPRTLFWGHCRKVSPNKPCIESFHLDWRTRIWTGTQYYLLDIKTATKIHILIHYSQSSASQVTESPELFSNIIKRQLFPHINIQITRFTMTIWSCHMHINISGKVIILIQDLAIIIIEKRGLNFNIGIHLSDNDISKRQ